MKFLFAFALIFFAAFANAMADDGSLRQVSIQLKWFHQFQFGGYYQAIEQGYFRDAGLSVTLIEGGPSVDSVKAVTDKRADFGVSNSQLILDRANGAPVVAVAAVFQHSPVIVIAKDSIFSVHHLAGKRMMIESGSAELMDYLLSEQVPIQSIVALPHTGNPLDLVNADVDALTAYTTVEPYQLDQAGVPYRIFDPRASGIDFYGDTLFTSEAMAKRNPELVRKLRDAVIKGWTYALAHQRETVDLIVARYQPKIDRGALLYEARLTEKLAIPDVVAIGYMNPGRWQAISESFIRIGMTDRTVDMAKFLFDTQQKADLRPLYYGLAGLSAVAAVAIVIATLMRRLNRKLSVEIANRIALEEQLRHIAFHDPLTHLPNRRLLRDRLDHALHTGKRHGNYVGVLYLDLDNFKELNDTHGHGAGDRLLIEVAARLRRAVRDSDTVARLGGDEFVVLLEGLGPMRKQAADYVDGVAEKVRQALNESYDLEGIGYRGTVSIGVKLVHEDENDPDRILHDADSAMYESKKAGRQGYPAADVVPGT